MSMQKPIVTTSIGCEGIDVTHNENVTIEDKPEQFAKVAIRLFSDQVLLNKLIENGYQLAKSKYDCSVFGSQIEEAFSTLKSASANSGKPIVVKN